MTENQTNQSSQLERDSRTNYHRDDEEGQPQRRFEGNRGGHRGSDGHRGGVGRGGGGGRGGSRGGYNNNNNRRDDNNADSQQGGWRVESNDGESHAQGQGQQEERRFDRPQGNNNSNTRGGYRDGGRGGRGGFHADPERGGFQSRGGRGGGDFQRRGGNDNQRRDAGDYQPRDQQRRDNGDYQGRDNQRREGGGDYQRRDDYHRDTDDSVQRREENEHHQQSRPRRDERDGEGEHGGEQRYQAPQQRGGRFQGNDGGFRGPSSRVRAPREEMDLKPLRYENRVPEQREHREAPAQHRGGGGGERDEYDVEAPPRSHRTERAFRLRRNNFDLAEVDELFAMRHNQRGISFDNYECIAVEIVPNDIEAVTTFHGLNIHPILAENVARCGYEKPTPVQKYGIPVSMHGKDLMACAQTGSGKTAAFLVPAVNHILVHGTSPAANRVSYPIALIMAPTRELALQIYDESRKLAYKSDIFCDVVYGGTSYPHHFEQDILVACPGRLKDIFDRNQLSFSRTKFLILDEADRMLEMGFEEQIEYLVASVHSDMPPPEQRQTLMFSATFPVPIRNLAQKYLRRQYYLLTVGRVGSTTRNITQKVMWAEDDEKQEKLMELLYQQNQTDLVLIFVETKRSAEDLYALLYDAGIPTGTIHGDRKQNEREEALRRFKDGRTPILVATDVASRGLDIPNVAHVIQYDLPRSMDDYTHRIGRTGRAGNEGIATSFFNGGNGGLTEELYGYLSEHEQHVPEWMESMKEEREMQHFVTSNNKHSSRRGGGGPGGRGRGSSRRDDVPTSWDDEPRAPQRRGGGGRGGQDSAAAPAPKKHTIVRSTAGSGF
ncbi:ATP-dependent DEAD/DEAH box RNA helicase, putative [Bodo saltans]|uniref:Probable eukaryotic initiation factor 4A n=1 Tax=Bodo saltans TaxID=75058 RepID=A0A0S4JDN6_BODSA|nr:ATP-dependent DEAD/DEAH box RNA helicase, putative [Bodo saltans]|eukprot:CUG89592.1 ATP-dependent DEAD/DEAH box RNA helicase, putative [Bodo saltans]